MNDNLAALERLLEQERARSRYARIDSYYPESGPLRRSLYHKHLEFFAAGANRRERAFIAANRIGKTEGVGAYECTLHLTGRYPAWWQGRRFNHPVLAWAAGDTSKTVRDIIQRVLLGPPGEFGTGMIPADCLLRTTVKPGISDAIETIYVKHASGGTSELGLKSFDQGRESFQGTNRHIVWLDEEAAREIYVESLLRTMNVNGMVLLTFTPLLGMTELCRDFLQIQESDTGKFTVQATWDDVPHLSEAAKAELLASIPPYQKEARSKGVPQLGSGAIYQIPEADIVIPDMPIPDHYARGYGLDVGWSKTAAVWGAQDRDTGVTYLYAEYYRGQAEPAVHAAAIKARGSWIPGVCDPAAWGRSQVDGNRLIDLYREQGLNLGPADNAVEAGLYKVYSMLSTGKLKVFRSLQNWLQEFRLYARDADGKVIKSNDHLMDSTRYLVLSGMFTTRPKPPGSEAPRYVNWNPNSGTNWLLN